MNPFLLPCAIVLVFIVVAATAAWVAQDDPPKPDGQRVRAAR